MAAAAVVPAVPGGGTQLQQPPGLSRSELQGMLGQCLKLASENKITPQNTWGLPLIEHLPDLIKEEGRGSEGTNFQRASVTLDAGVKIYSYRVDSVHTETYKMLGGLGRASGPSGGGDDEEGEDGDPGEGGVERARRRRAGGELDPEATLEASLEALNVRKFDLAFAVDPLFHKTSAQFDEGGAKGLLLANLGVYAGCDIVFDSMDVPEAAVDAATAAEPLAAAATVDLSGLGAAALAALATGGGEGSQQRLSPALDGILALLGAAPPQDAATAADAFVAQVAEAAGDVAPTQPLAALLRPAATAATADSGAPAVMDAEGDGPRAAQEGDGGEDVAPEYAYADDAGAADGDDYGGGKSPQRGGRDSSYRPSTCRRLCPAPRLLRSSSAPALSPRPAPPWATDFDDGFGGGFDDASDDDSGVAAQVAASGGAPGVVVGGPPLSTSKLSKAAGAGGLGDEAIQWLISAAGSTAAGAYVTGAKGWAGASHWRYRTLPPAAGGGAADAEDEEGGGGEAKKRGSRKRNEPLDFVALLAAPEPVVELLPAGSGRRRARPSAKTLLPEDHHYSVEALGRYALRPRAAVAYTAVGAAEPEGTAAADAFGNDGFGAGKWPGGGSC